MSFVDSLAARFGYQRAPTETVEKASREGMAQTPDAGNAYAAIGTAFGIRRPSGITQQTLRRMSRVNWVDRACIFTLRDEITSIPWDIVPVDPKKPYNPTFQAFLLKLLKSPNRNNENWRTFIDKVVEDILVIDAGTIEKVRNDRGQVVELYHVDGATVRPVFDEHGVAQDIAYEQYMIDKLGQMSLKPVAEWANNDLIYIMWNPQGAVDTFGFGFSPVEAGLAVGTAFLYAEAYNLGFFKTNTIPPVMINMGKDVPPGQVEQFKAFMNSEVAGPNGIWKPIVGSFADGFDIKELMHTPTEMGFKEYVEWQMRWKVALYRMSPQDIGFSLDQYKVEGQVQQQLSKNKAINSLKNVLADYINREIVDDDGFTGVNENLQFAWIDTAVVDPLVQAQIDKIRLDAGVESVNEIRRRDGLDPIIGGRHPSITVGSTLVPLDETPLEQPDEDEESAAVAKSFQASEGVITSLAENHTAICWMDDRGVTQPFFVTDFGRHAGFAAKPSFLDERKDQTPPEQKVADMLRLLKVNTPEVQILDEDAVLKLLPTTLYGDWTKYLAVEAPYDSKEWRDRWGTTRKSPYYIVAGFITGRDLGNADLQTAMAASPESYRGTVRDFARVWLAERRFYLGDRKPGHYIVTDSGSGFGVDYQFFEDETSWRKTSHFLPQTLAAIHPSLGTLFVQAVKDEAASFGIAKSHVEKALRTPKARGWEEIPQAAAIERGVAESVQKRLLAWYRKAVHVKQLSQRPTVRKATEFDAEGDYLTDGVHVFQNGVQFPLSVLDRAKQPTSEDLIPTPGDYRDTFDLGALEARLALTTQFPDITVRNAELYAPAFERRANFIADTVSDSLKKDVNATIVRGIDGGKSYGEIAQDIQTTLGIDPGNPEMPGYRAERIARTEAMWSINEGMRQQYQDSGIQKVNVSVASDACDECVDLASGNPYTLADAEGLLPQHSNCRCVLIGDWSALLAA